MSLIDKLNGFLTNTSSVGQVSMPAELPKVASVSGNPFLNQNNPDNSVYGKNMPVAGGYFAGYLNGKANIVGQKLFVLI